MTFPHKYYIVLFVSLLALPSLEAEVQPEEPRNEGDALSWLEQELTCEQFREQVQRRFAQFGKMSKLPPEKKSELRIIMDAACAEKFSHCGFKNCKSRSLQTQILSPPIVNTSSSAVSSSAFEEKAAIDIESELSKTETQQENTNKISLSQLKRLVLLESTRHKDSIRLQIEEEKAKTLSWKAFSLDAINVNNERP